MLQALKSGQREVMIAGFKETLGTYLQRFAPAVLWRVIKNYNIKAVEG
jgi:hypothetical protein